ncbi:MAG: DedA family protein [Candidatus Pacebacteria bacterium]|nr:DedA family protein [Candidatus Paceibacterota bacterium]
MGLLSTIASWSLEVIDKTGYAGVFVLSSLESAGIPIPSEVVIPFSGFLAVQGRFSFLGVVLTATLANVFGSLILYLIGRSGGRWILEKYGKYVLIHKKDLDTGDRWFYKYGSKIIFFGRLLPVVRTFISLPAGIAKMNLVKFLFYTVLGALPWNFALAEIGVKLGEKWDLLHSYFQKFDIIIVLFAAGVAAWYLYKHLKKNGQKTSHI